LEENLSLRAEADSLFRKIEKSTRKNVEVDFRNVKFVSRSFAHQYLLRKESSKKNVSEINMSSQTRKIFKIARKKSDSVRFDYSEWKVSSLPA